MSDDDVPPLLTDHGTIITTDKQDGEECKREPKQVEAGGAADEMKLIFNFDESAHPHPSSCVQPIVLSNRGYLIRDYKKE